MLLELIALTSILPALIEPAAIFSAFTALLCIDSAVTAPGKKNSLTDTEKLSSPLLIGKSSLPSKVTFILVISFIFLPGIILFIINYLVYRTYYQKLETYLDYNGLF